MARRKIILMIVEGPSDVSLLVPSFSALLAGRTFRGQEFHCDVLTAPNHREEFHRRNGFYPSNDPKSTVRELVEHYLRDHDHTWGQLGHVLQVCDLDGTFIPDEQVTENPFVDATHYSTDGIVTRNRESLIADRTTRRTGIRSMLEFEGFRKKTGGRTMLVPYRLFYVSRNLEHAFLGDAGDPTDDRKKSGAAALAARFTADPGLFATTLESLRHLHGSPADWRRSWEYATTDMHSLERGSNLAFVEPYLDGETV